MLRENSKIFYLKEIIITYNLREKKKDAYNNKSCTNKFQKLDQYKKQDDKINIVDINRVYIVLK